MNDSGAYFCVFSENILFWFLRLGYYDSGGPLWIVTWFWRNGQGSWVDPTSAIILFKEILWGWTVGQSPSSPPYSTIDLRCGLIYCTLNYAHDYPQW
jgi:hypothetical protein